MIVIELKNGEIVRVRCTDKDQSVIVQDSSDDVAEDDRCEIESAEEHGRLWDLM